jgi:hypothetical protein
LILLVFLIAHFIGDYIFQSKEMAEKKRWLNAELIKHSGIYTFVVAAILLCSVDMPKTIFPIIIVSVMHFVVDSICIKLKEGRTPTIQFMIYAIDQAVHIIVILIVVFPAFDLNNQIAGVLDQLINRFGTNAVNNCEVYILIYLLMLNPAAITIKRLLLIVSNQNEKDEGIKNVGYLIGILERVIATTLVLQNQFAAIGFILAAKSIARYKQLEHPPFVEKYLVGTLASLTIAIIVTLALAKVLI